MVFTSYRPPGGICSNQIVPDPGGTKCLEHNTVRAQVGGWVPERSTVRVRTLNVEKFAKIYQILAHLTDQLISLT